MKLFENPGVEVSRARSVEEGYEKEKSKTPEETGNNKETSARVLRPEHISLKSRREFIF